jgi:hypothetical protein
LVAAAVELKQPLMPYVASVAGRPLEFGAMVLPAPGVGRKLPSEEACRSVFVGYSAVRGFALLENHSCST